MKSYIQIEDLVKSFGDCVLFEHVTLGVYEGDKIGLIAKNGVGKTTFLRILAGEEPYDAGRIVFRNDLRVGYLPQVPQFPAEMTILDACLSADDAPSRAIRRYEQVLQSADAAQISDAMHEMDVTGAWDYEDRMKRLLGRFNIKDVNQRAGELSGGQSKRVALVKLLLEAPDMLILDEPTNHLDIDMIEWLEDYLCHSRSTLLMVTHDRYFLDKVCTKILEIDERQFYAYDGNYDYYLEKRGERINAQNAELAKVKNLLRTELEWMRRQPQARGSKAKYRIDAFHELDRRSKISRDEQTVQLNVKSSYIGSKIFVAHDVSKKFGDTVILKDFNYVFSRYEKLGIVGNNGVGKSTFVKLLLGEIKPDSGYFDVGETVSFGYYSQDGISFNENEKVIDAVRRIAEYVVFDEKTHYTAAQFLQLFLFDYQTQQKYIAKLSGGEKRRLYLATVLMRKPNFLILDEPTNDLDIVTLGILEEYLRQFKGCVIIVSHDRFFMDRTVDHLFVFEGQGAVRDFPGNYSTYRAWKEENRKEEAAKEKLQPHNGQKTEPAKRRDNLNKMTFKEKKEFEELSAQLPVLEREKAEIEGKLSQGITDVEEITRLSQRLTEVLGEIDEKEIRWLELSEKDG